MRRLGSRPKCERSWTERHNTLRFPRNRYTWLDDHYISVFKQNNIWPFVALSTCVSCSLSNDTTSRIRIYVSVVRVCQKTAAEVEGRRPELTQNEFSRSRWANSTLQLVVSGSWCVPSYSMLHGHKLMSSFRIRHLQCCSVLTCER